MKKMLKVSLVYVVLALIGGVFYREFTKLSGFTGVTTLSTIHVHLMILGVFMFMILALFAKSVPLLEDRNFKKVFTIYNIGVTMTVIMLVVRGITEVATLSLSYGMDMAISGMAGVSHIILGIGIIWLVLILIRVSDKEK